MTGGVGVTPDSEACVEVPSSNLHRTRICVLFCGTSILSCDLGVLWYTGTKADFHPVLSCPVQSASPEYQKDFSEACYGVDVPLYIPSGSVKLVALGQLKFASSVIFLEAEHSVRGERFIFNFPTSSPSHRLIRWDQSLKKILPYPVVFRLGIYIFRVLSDTNWNRNYF